MRYVSKVCDAADWFDPELQKIIQEELQEPARFHRKQWEFAIIFLALKKHGMLDPAKVGLSVGGGNERVLYAIARHIRHLTVTDLYDQNTDWDCARTDDPDLFIKQSKPFPVEDNKIQALRMDMRQLDFEDQSFDFCYSSCAIEHIGEYGDFLQHFNEVYRVLKTNGIYVFTTEFHFGEESIQDQNNYIFSGNYLKNLISDTDFSVEVQPQVKIWQHRANLPLPSNVANLCYGNNDIHESLLVDTLPHIHLLRGRFPFTSISLILRKSIPTSKVELKFEGLQETQKFHQDGIVNYRRQLQEHTSSLHPFSGMGKSPFYADHAEYFSQISTPHRGDNTVFHTDYFWFGSDTRYFQIQFTVQHTEPTHNCVIELRVHRIETLNSQNVDCIYNQVLILSGENPKTVKFSIETAGQFSYALLGKCIEGSCMLSHLEILSRISPFVKETVSMNTKEIQTESFTKS